MPSAAAMRALMCAEMSASSRRHVCVADRGQCHDFDHEGEGGGGEERGGVVLRGRIEREHDAGGAARDRGGEAVVREAVGVAEDGHA